MLSAIPQARRRFKMQIYETYGGVMRSTDLQTKQGRRKIKKDCIAYVKQSFAELAQHKQREREIRTCALELVITRLPT